MGSKKMYITLAAVLLMATICSAAGLLAGTNVGYASTKGPDEQFIHKRWPQPRRTSARVMTAKCGVTASEPVQIENWSGQHSFSMTQRSALSKVFRVVRMLSVLVPMYKAHCCGFNQRTIGVCAISLFARGSVHSSRILMEMACPLSNPTTLQRVTERVDMLPQPAGTVHAFDVMPGTSLRTYTPHCAKMQPPGLPSSQARFKVVALVITAVTFLGTPAYHPCVNA
mmetsp:Transcript_119611/g.381687  ORF Transcript_119611/g.381687 Transcript_119611/m.381687 type:complete len:226 (+) Transcript_119611:4695-5372(+)